MSLRENTFFFFKRRIEHNLTFAIFRFKQAYIFFASAAWFVERSIHRKVRGNLSCDYILIGDVSRTRDRKLKIRADTRDDITLQNERGDFQINRSFSWKWVLRYVVEWILQPCEFSRRKCAANPMQIKHPRIGSYLANTPDVAS